MPFLAVVAVLLVPTLLLTALTGLLVFTADFVVFACT
jgi:hypothetical protein